MKNTTKISFLLISFLFVHFAFAQCTPNTQMPKGAILPESLKVGYKNTPYSDVIYYRAPLDTSATTQFGTFPVRIDSMEIIKVEGLPAGFTYQCNTGNCRFNGGESGCLTLTGTLSTTGSFPIKVYLKTYATVKTTFADLPQTQEDINEKYVLTINAAVGMAAIGLNDAVAIFPNPVKDVLYVQSKSEKSNEVSLTDVTGRLLYVGKFDEQCAITTNSFSSGVYFIKLSSGGETLTRKIVIE